MKHLRKPTVRMLTLCCVLAVTTLLFSGCGPRRPKLVRVSGKVLIDGQPLTYGMIRFVPVGSRASVGSLDGEGRFELSCFDHGDGAITGKHRVEIRAAEPMGDSAYKWLAPKKYASANTSELEQDITGPTDSLIIELTWDGAQPFVEGVPRATQEVSGDDERTLRRTRKSASNADAR